MNNEQNRELQIFEHELFGGIRAVVKDGSPWFVRNDVCRVLDIVDARQAAARLKKNQRGVYSMYTSGGNQRMAIISEAGLFALIFTSRKPEAIEFQDWVCEEVLPSIRKTGGYSISADSMQLQLNILESRIRSLEIDKEVANAPVRRLSIPEFRKHLIDRYPYLTNSKVLGVLCEHGIIYLITDDAYWPTKYAISEGMFEIETEAYVSKKGVSGRYQRFYATPKGLVEISRILDGV